VAAVISNRPDAAGLAFAREQGIATLVVDNKLVGSREAFDDLLARKIETLGADVVALAGFMRILSPAFVQRFAGRIVNVHPSLLPAFTGLNTHQRALDAGCKLAGATVHFVTAALDHGPIIMQAAVPVLPGDTAQSLSQRVLAEEHRIYPRALGWLVHDQLRVEHGVVTQTQGEPQWVMRG
jgi:phosphoribosylglycinamide formyltransferase-1